MKLYRIEHRYSTESRATRALCYRTSKSDAVKAAKELYKNHTEGGWQVRECCVPDRLSTGEWCEVLTVDMLMAQLSGKERAVGDFVTVGDVVARSKKRKKEAAND